MSLDSLAFNPLVIAAVVGALAAVIALIGWIHQGRRTKELEAEREVLQAVALKGKEILAAAPDGLFLWDHTLGGITISRRMAVLLNLPAGTHSRYDDIRARFEGDSLKALERACSALRGNGTPFDLVLQSDARIIHAIGSRAETEDGEALADLVWMRDISDQVSGRAQVVQAGTGTYNRSGLDDRHLTALLDAMPIPIWLRDSSLALAFTNKAATGLAETNPEMAERARAAAEAVRERRLIDVGGDAKLYEFTEIPLGLGGDGDTRAGGTLGFAIDRTEHEEKEVEQQRHAAAQGVVLDSVPTAIAIYDSETRLESFNRAFADLWSLDRAWLAAKPKLSDVLERLRGERRLPEVADFPAFKAEETARFRALAEPMSDLIHLPDGRTFRRRIAPQGGGGLIYIYEDLSERLDLERSFKELGAVQLETLDNLHEGVAVFGSDGRLKLHNPVYARLWNIDETALRDGPHVSDVIDLTRAMLPPPEGSDNWTDDEWTAHKSLLGARLLSRAQKEGRIHLANDTVVDYANVPLPDGAVLLSYVDVTDSARVERALRERARAYQEADQMKSKFIANVSHEVRTPLNTVIGFADMLGQEYFGDLNSRQAEYARGILDTSRSLMSVVGDILDIAAIDAGQMELKLEPVDIHGLMVSALNLVRDQAKRKEMKVEFECAPNIGWMTADGGRVKQMTYNLLANAVDFTPPRGTVGLAAKRDGSDVVITVTDTGVGIPTPERDRIFEPFDRGGEESPANTADDTGEARGVGLGLTLVKRIAELHAGSVEVRSQTGRGTTIICRLRTSPPSDGGDGESAAASGETVAV